MIEIGCVKTFRRRGTLLVLLLGLCFLMSSSIVASEAITSIPIQLYGKHVLIKVSVNGHPKEWFVFDSGASHNMIDEKYAQEIGLTATDSTWVAGFAGKQRTAESKENVIRIGESETDKMAFTYVQNLDPSGRVKGYLGGSFLRRNVVALDYKRKQLEIYSEQSFSYHGKGEQLSADHRAGVPAVQTALFLDGDTLLNGWFFIDTGASASVICNPWVEKAYQISSQFKDVQEIKLAGYGGGFKTLMGRCDSLSLGQQVLKDISVQMQITDAPRSPSTHSYYGFIGADLLVRFKVYFDYRRLRVILEPNTLILNSKYSLE